MHFRSLKKSAGDLYLSDSIDTDSNGNSLSIMDVISVPDDMLDNISSMEISDQLRRYVSECLTDREEEIINMRYGLDGNIAKTQREVAALCGISRSYVSRIEKKALQKLHKRFEDAESPGKKVKP